MVVLESYCSTDLPKHLKGMLTLRLFIGTNGRGYTNNILQRSFLQQLAYSFHSKRCCRTSSETKLHATLYILCGLPSCLLFKLILTSHCSHSQA